MIFLGYNYLQDAYCYQPFPTYLTNINGATIKDGIYDHVNITKDTELSYITDIPVAWTTSTILDAGFKDTINAGNVDYVVSQISAIRVKRRLTGTFDWITLFEIPVSDVSDIDFTKYDYLCKNNTSYDYAIVPIVGGIEGNYNTNSIISNYYGVFITDQTKAYKFLNNVTFSNNQRVHLTGIYQPYGNKYPIIAANGNLDYEMGTVNGDIMVINNHELDRQETVNTLTAIKDFLINDTAKVLKDLNGNIWLVSITDNLPVAYSSEVGMGIANLGFNWVEIGDSQNKQDLYDEGLIPTLN